MRIRSKRQLAIIGNGMATCRLLDELLAREAQSRYDITVFGEEKGGAYNRILLSRVLGGEKPDRIVTKPREWYQSNGVRLFDGVEVTRLDTSAKQVETASGERHPYDVAVLATGGQPLVPPLVGMITDDGELRPGVFVYRTIDDCLRMRAHLRPGDNAIVLGGGLLGLEAAKVLCDAGLHVTVVHAAQTLMNAQLDPMAGEMLCRQIEHCGIFVRTGQTVQSVRGDAMVEGVTLNDGKTLPADLLIVACGVRPRVAVARASDVPINKGIIVNDLLATEIPGVYAVGECAEHRGRTYGIVAPAWEQVAVLADVLTGANLQARYQGSNLYTRLKVAGIEVATMGCATPELESDDVIEVVENRRSAYRKLILREGRLVGAMLVGNTTAAASLVQTLDRGTLMPADPLEALCASALQIPQSPSERLVCHCHKVTEEHVQDAVTAGATSVEAVGNACRAGTGCGSCKSELTRLVLRFASPVRRAASA